ncbi:MAG: hypothetical protein EOM10_11550, partial [Opitutae bacterium]|nr:hypothetical protein [Opitutae bacterium]
MNTATFADYHLSRLMLGTVQFGLSYGIANRQGRPSYAVVRDILACAFEGGVNCLDTAAAYGESEELIGRALRELGLADRVIVVTKVRESFKRLEGLKVVYVGDGRNNVCLSLMTGCAK